MMSAKASMPRRCGNITAVALAMALMWPTTSFADSYEDGKAAFLREDYETAMAILQPIAELDARAQARLAEMYLGGLGTAQNFELALFYAGKAADNGNARGQYVLGSMYRDGKGVEKDLGKAISLFRKAAEQDFAWAKYNLGLIYYVGEGVPSDLVQAYGWFALAALPHPDDDQNAERTASDLVDVVGARLTPDQLKEAKEWMRQWQAAHKH